MKVIDLQIAGFSVPLKRKNYNISWKWFEWEGEFFISVVEADARQIDRPLFQVSIQKS